MNESRERHFGPIASVGDEPTTFEVDVGALVRRLILFEHCYLESINLEEIPALLNVFGYEGLKELLRQPDFEIIDDRILSATLQNNIDSPTKSNQKISKNSNGHDIRAVSIVREAAERPDFVKSILGKQI